MLTRRHFCTGAATFAALASVSTSIAAAPLRPSFDTDARGLAARARDARIRFGAATANYQLKDKAFRAAFLQDAALIVPEYEMKRSAMEKTRGQIDFGPCDELLAFARANNMAMRGHTLLWHRANPDWLEEAVLTTRDETLITDYVTKVTTHYRGKLTSLDVVNEVIAPPDARKDGLRNSFWLKAFGPSYIDMAYHAARAAAPDMMLVYNDWGCEQGAPENDRFRAATLNFLEGALARGVPIDAYGMQGHLSAFGTQIDAYKLRKFCDAITAMGLKLIITEHDVDDSGGSSDLDVRDRAVADASARFLDVVLDCKALDTVLTWGLSNKFIDAPGWKARLSGYWPRKLPRDSNMAKTQMWHAMAKTFAHHAAN